MNNIYQPLSTIFASSCGALTTVPFDILQTKILSNKSIDLSLQELKFVLFMSILFSIQNNVYVKTSFLNNNFIRGSLAGLSTVPFYILLESKKINLRLGIYPTYKKFIFLITIRQLVVFVTLYSVLELNIFYKNFISALLANSFGFPLRILALKQAYPILNLNFNNIIKTGLLEIFKSSIGDSTSLYLLSKL